MESTPPTGSVATTTTSTATPAVTTESGSLAETAMSSSAPPPAVSSISSDTSTSPSSRQAATTAPPPQPQHSYTQAELPLQGTPAGEHPTAQARRTSIARQRHEHTSAIEVTGPRKTAQTHVSKQPPPYAPTVLDTKNLPGPMSMNLLGDCGAVQPLDEISGYLPQYSKSLFGRSTIMTNLVPSCTTACGATAAWVWLGGKFPDTIDTISRSHFRTLVYGRRIRTFNRKVTPDQVSTIGTLKLTTPARTACDVILMEEDDEGHRFGKSSYDDVDGAIWQTGVSGAPDDAPYGRYGGYSGYGKDTFWGTPGFAGSEEIRRKHDAAAVQSYRSQARETACALIQEFHFTPEDCLAILDANRLWPNQARAWRFFTSIRYCF